MEKWQQEKLNDLKAIMKFVRQRLEKKQNEKIRVAFMCQYIPAWNKVEPIYNEMKKRMEYEPILLCIPSKVSNNQLENPEDNCNDTYEYYREHGYDAINTLIGKNQWLDLSGMNLDYVFYLRPYNSYMPEPYVSSAVSNYAKICVVMYGMTLTKEVMKVTIEHDFFRNVYYYFAESDYAMHVNKKSFPFTHLLGLQKTVFYGMPAMSQIMDMKGCSSEAWNFSDAEFRVMWTPRWTTDKSLGGTNFFEYKDWLLDYAEKHPQIAFLFRPHPLAFNNFVKCGEMTETEVKNYKQRCQEAKNVQIDTEQEYVASMWNSSALISDISGVMPEYFVMDKPLIYCASNMILEPADHTIRMLEGCYVVENQEQMQACLENLEKGIDPLKGKRHAIIDELFGDTLENSTDLIINEIWRDYHGIKKIKK